MRPLALFRRAAWASAAVAAVATGCVDPVLDDQGLTVEATSTVIGLAFLDLDGNGAFGAADEVAEEAGIWLVSGGAVVRSTETDSLGLFLFSQVPVGTYRVRVDPASLEPGASATEEEPILLAVGDTVEQVVRLDFPGVPLDQVRALPAGLRVATSGIVLNVRLPFGDGLMHVQSGSTYLRGIDVERTSVQIGDSVRLLGTTARSEGQPVLSGVEVFPLLSQAALVRPLETGTAEAAGARGGVLDAAFVRIRSALVVDTAAAGEDFVVTADDGSGPVQVLLRDFLGFNRSAFEPGAVQIQEGAGLLVPVQGGDGTVLWRLVPRATGDLVVRTAAGPPL